MNLIQQHAAKAIQRLMIGAVHFTIEKYIASMVSQIMEGNVIRKLAFPGHHWDKGKTKAQLHAFSDIEGVVALQRNAGLKPHFAADFLCKRMQAVASAHGDEGFMLKIPGG